MGNLVDDKTSKHNSVGEEFIEWAEQYWLLDKLVNGDDSNKFIGERCDYSYMRSTFIEKIDSIIKKGGLIIDDSCC